MLRMRAISVKLLVVALFCVVGLMARNASASTISWGTAQNISGPTDVSTDGTLVVAYSFGNANPWYGTTTVNGVPFVDASSDGPSWVEYCDSGAAGGHLTALSSNLYGYGTVFGYGSVTDPSYQRCSQVGGGAASNPARV